MSLARTSAIAAALALALGWAMAGRPSLAQELPRHVFAVDPDEEVQDLLFLGDARPALIRLRIRVDGEGHRGRWLEFVRRLQAEADSNRDGVVSRAEADSAIVPILQLQAAGGDGFRVAQSRRAVQFNSQAVGFDEMVERMRAAYREFEIVNQPPAEPSNDEATFVLLDRDRDGLLTRDELSDVAAALARLDVDDDETIDAGELGPYRNPFFANATVVRQQNGMPAQASTGGAVVSATDQAPRTFGYQVLRRYDRKPMNGSLDPDEIAIGREAFDRIDANQDGALDTSELEKAVGGAPDLELDVRLGHREPGRAAIEPVGPSGHRPPFGAPGVRRVDDLLLIELPSTVIELEAEADGTDPSSANRSNLEAQFRGADLDGNGVVDKVEAQRFIPLRSLFGVADRDGDGKLTRDEWRAMIARQAEISGLRTTLRAADQGRSFLDLLDANRDRRLGLRELRDAPRRILLEDRDGDGRVSPREFAGHHRWTVVRGQVSPAQLPAQFQPVRPPPSTSGRPATAGQPAAPEWFRKMDRNRDGDLSPREFLGTRAAFEAYDADRDGLIAPSEASRRP